jgi:hypothetical protein
MRYTPGALEPAKSPKIPQVRVWHVVRRFAVACDDRIGGVEP